MKNCVKLSPCWFLFLLLTLFACTPGDIIQTTRPSHLDLSPTGTPVALTLPSATPMRTPKILETLTSTSIPALTPLTETTPTPTSTILPSLTPTPAPSATPEPPFPPTPTPIPPTRQFLPSPCPGQQPPPHQDLKIFFSQNGELRRWENGAITALTVMNGRRVQVLDNGRLIVFTRDNGLWAINDDGSQERFLTTGINENYLSISEDGTVIAFVKDRELWAINSDGSQERVLVSESDFAAMPPVDPGVRLGQIYWIPCTHQLLFDTQPMYENGIYFNDDLYLVDADTLLLKNLFPPGTGGRVFFSPNGQQMALVTPGSIALANYDGSSPQTVLTYWPISTGSSYPFYPRPIWSADSQSLYVAIPPNDPLYDYPDPTALWSLPVYSGEAIKLAEFRAAWGESSVAPDLSLIAYPTIIREGENISWTLHIIQPDGTGIASFPERVLVNWLPDSTHFTFRSNGALYVGDLSGESVPIIGVEREILSLFWIDSTHFLLYHRDETGLEKLSLGTIGGELIIIAQGKIETYAIAR